MWTPALFVGVTLLLSGTYAHRSSGKCSGQSIGSPADVDYLVFSQQWPQTVCIDAKSTHEHQCKIPDNVTTWGVHGVWPTKYQTRCPNFCNTSSSFDPVAIKGIEDKLDMFWPNLYAETPADDFWIHEWCKHGTCAVSIPNLSGEINYFSSGLALHDKFSMDTILGKYGITPRAEMYEYTDVHKALETEFPGAVTFSCVYDKSSKTQYLMQIELCLSKDFKPISCSTKSHSGLETVHTTCKPQGMLYNNNNNSNNQVQMLQGELMRTEACRATEMISYPVITHK